MDVSGTGPNVSALVLPNELGPPRQSVAGEEIQAEFLSLRQLNKHAHLRISPFPLDSKAFEGPTSLLAVANSKAAFAAVVRTVDAKAGQQFAIALGSTNSIRDILKAGKPDDTGLVQYQPQRTFDLGSEKPVALKFAAKDEKLVVGFNAGPILVFDVNAFLDPTSRPVPHVFQSDAVSYPRIIAPNPGDHPELVAVLRGIYGQERGHYVEILDVVKGTLVGAWHAMGNVNALPMSLAWSPRGKQIAIGVHCGDILLYAPQDTSALKGRIPRSADPALANNGIFSINWLSNNAFHVVYSHPTAAARFDPETIDMPEQTHVIIHHDHKNPAASFEVRLSDNPCPPFGAKRLPGSFSVILRNWGNLKALVFAGDGPSADIGAIGQVGDKWGNLATEETSRAALPLTAEMDESGLMALDVDLSSTEQIDNSEQPGDDIPPGPPAPILLAYTTDGVLCAWHIISQNDGAYPEMVTKVAGITPVSAMSVRATTPLPPAPSAATPSTAPASLSPFGTQATPAFGSTGFGAAPAAPTFGSTGFGATISSAPTAPAASSGSGFGAFAAKPAGFGDVAKPGASPFGTASSSSPFGATSGSKPTPFGTGVTSPSFGFGQTSQASEQPSPFTTAAGKPSAFGNIPSTSPFSAAASGQPATSSSTLAGSALAVTQAQPSSGFGGTQGTPSGFGQTGFGFGQPGFGQASSLGAPKPVASSTGTSGAGAFSAFASKPVTFGTQATAESKPAATALSPSAAAATSAFGQPTTAAPAFGQSGLGGFGKPAQNPAFGQSGFGTQPAAASTSTPTQPAPSRSGSAFSSFADLGSSVPAPDATASSPGGPGSDTSSVVPSPAATPPPEARRPAVTSRSSASNVGTGLGAFTRPGSGFGAFGGPVSTGTSAFARAASGTVGQSQGVATAGFGMPALATPTTTSGGGVAFGQSTFGQGPAFIVAKPAAEKSKITTPVSGGFGSFSSGGGGFGTFAPQNKASPFGTVSKETAEKQPPATPSQDKSKDKADAAKLFDGSGSSKPANTFSPGAAIRKASDSEDDEDKPGKEVFPEEELSSKDPVTTIDPDLSFDNIGLTAGPKVQTGVGPVTPVTPKKDLPVPSPGMTPATPVTPGATPGPETTTPSTVFSPSPSKTPATPGASSAIADSSPFKTPVTSSPFGSFASSTKAAVALTFGTPATPAPTTPSSSSPSRTPATPGATSGTPASPATPAGFSTMFQGPSIFGKQSGNSAHAPPVSAFSGTPTTLVKPVFGVDDSTGKSQMPRRRSSHNQLPAPPETPAEQQKPVETPKSLLARMGPPPPDRVEPLPPGSDEETEEGDGSEEDLEEVQYEDQDYDENGEPYYNDEEEEEPDEDEEEEDRESEEDDEEEPNELTEMQATVPISDFSRAPATPGNSVLKSTPPSSQTPLFAKPAGESSSNTTASSANIASAKLFGIGSGRPAIFGGTAAAPSRSSPLAAPPVTVGSPGSPTKAQRQVLLSPTSPTGERKSAFSALSQAAASPSSAPSGPITQLPGFMQAGTETSSASSASMKLGPPPSGGFFATKPAPSPHTPTAGAFSNLFTPKSQPAAGSQPGGAVPIFSTPGFFAQKPPGAAPFAASAAGRSLSAAVSTPPAPSTTQPTSLQGGAAQPMPSETPLQQQFALLFIHAEKEIEKLVGETKAFTQAHAKLAVSRGGRNLADLSHVEKWGFGDLIPLTQAIRSYERDVNAAKERANAIAESVAELQGMGSQIGVKREQLKNIKDARNDPTIRQTLEDRELGPEQMETRTKLRRQVELVQDRVEQLEGVVQGVKRRVDMSGRHKIEAPSLELVNRTCRNMDIALEQRSSDISSLTARVNSLDLSRKASKRANGVPAVQNFSSDARSSSNTQVYVKAADIALASESTAVKLRDLLDKTRPAAVVTKIDSARPPLRTLPPPISKSPPLGSSLPLGSSQGELPLMFPPGQTIKWPSGLASSSSPGSAPTPSAADRASGSSSKRSTRHQESVKIGSTRAEGSPSPASAFNWGPLPGRTTS
ncbi:hypothetical protein BKA62DRAFT_663553 [Auriculariales sp. MPI-PUGE-AT-0066]|nr:hypothetical protein BKA62DRAFT_663553 [Auriculariales sp. MPI-PUGE-AT-0066]